MKPVTTTDTLSAYVEGRSVATPPEIAAATVSLSYEIAKYMVESYGYQAE